MTPFHYITGDFLKARSRRIGASDIPALIPNPEHPTQSLAGYDRTALTVWEEKTGRRARDPAGLPAEMGHWIEPKAVEVFLRPIFGEDYAEDWLIRRIQYDTLKRRNPDINARDYQIPPVHHSVQWYDDRFICHPDGVFKPDWKGEKSAVTAHNTIFDLMEPFLIEAKSARYFSARRPEDSVVSGYDLELHTWQGIPLRHYVQIQFQLAVLGVDIAYLPLIYDTSSFHVWEIRADRKRQNTLIDIAGRMAWYIENDKPPKEMAINSADIRRLYPTIEEDFAYVTGEEREKAIEYAEMKNKAAAQEKAWKEKKKEATDALEVLMKDRGELRDEEGTICKWITRRGSEDLVKGIKEIRTENPTEYRYLKRKGLIEMSDAVRYVGVTKRGGEGE